LYLPAARPPARTDATALQKKAYSLAAEISSSISVPDLRRFDTDPDLGSFHWITEQEPALFFSGFQDDKKNKFLYFF
jgi:hypothetical protein